MKYDNANDANLYLNGSYVQWKKDVVYVRNIMEDMTVECMVVSTGKDVLVKLSELNLTPVKLGYVFDEEQKKSYYIERIPSRAWRQGLSNANVRAKNNRFFRMQRPSHSLTKAIFSDTYPSLVRARTRAKKEHVEIPFNRMFTIDKNFIIRYKTQVVGEWLKNEFVLFGEFSYIKELLKECSGENIRCN